MARIVLVGATLAGIGMGEAVVSSPAQAATWVASPAATGPRVCTSTRSYSDVFYQLCLDYRDQSHVAARPVVFIYASVTSYAQADALMNIGSTTYTFSCPTVQITGGKSLACYDAYRTISGTAIHNADATLGIDGSWRPTLRVRESRIRGTAQEDSTYCGPSAAQAALRIIGVDKSQSELAPELLTSSLGTTPSGMQFGMNYFLTGSGLLYDVYNYGLDGSVYRTRKSIDTALPVTLLVRPGDLPGGDAAWYYRHWITLHGWAGQVDGADSVTIDQFVFFDPGSGREFAGLSTTQMNTAALSAGFNPGELTFVAGKL